MKRKLLKLTLALSLFLTLLVPALAEEVKVLVDISAPYAKDVKWFPGGRYLLVIFANYQEGDWDVTVVDLKTGRWKPVQWVKSRTQLGQGPRLCIGDKCGYMVSAQGRGVAVRNVYEDPDCDWDANYDAKLARMGVGYFLYEAVGPNNLAVSASGHYALLRYMGPYGEYDPEYYGDTPIYLHGLWITRMNLVRESWDDVQAEQRRDPLIWELPPDRESLTANWYYDPAEKLDRLAVIDFTRPEAGVTAHYGEATVRLLVLEVQP